MDKAIKGYDEILEREIPFSEKFKLIMDKKYKATAELSSSAVSKYAWEDKTLQQLYKKTANSKAISVCIRFIELGKKEGVIDKSIPNDAMACGEHIHALYLFNFLSPFLEDLQVH